jgi:hypothetical protein
LIPLHAIHGNRHARRDRRIHILCPERISGDEFAGTFVECVFFRKKTCVPDIPCACGVDGLLCLLAWTHHHDAAPRDLSQAPANSGLPLERIRMENSICPTRSVRDESSCQVAVNGSLWSLPYEINCYLALTALWVLPIPRRVAVTGAVIVLGFILYSMPPIPPANSHEKYLSLNAVKLGLFFFVGAWFGMWRTKVRPTLWLGAMLVGVSLAISPSNVQTAVFVFGFAVFVLALGSSPGLLPKLPEKMGDWSYGLFLYGFPVQQVLAMFGLADAGIAVFAIASTAISLAFAGLSWFSVEKPALAIGRSNR